MAFSAPNFHENQNYCLFFFLSTVNADLSKSDTNVENMGKRYCRPQVHNGFQCAGTNLRKLAGVTREVVYRISP